MTPKPIALALISAGLLMLLMSCEPQMRIRNLSAQSLRGLGYSRYDVVIGQSRAYTNVLDLSNGRATIYQSLEADGAQWANAFTITATTNLTNVFTTNGLLVPENMRSMFQRGNRYVWDLFPTNALSVTLD